MISPWVYRKNRPVMVINHVYTSSLQCTFIMALRISIANKTSNNSFQFVFTDGRLKNVMFHVSIISRIAVYWSFYPSDKIPKPIFLSTIQNSHQNSGKKITFCWFQFGFLLLRMTFKHIVSAHGGRKLFIATFKLLPEF